MYDIRESNHWMDSSEISQNPCPAGGTELPKKKVYGVTQMGCIEEATTIAYLSYLVDVVLQVS